MKNILAALGVLFLVLVVVSGGLFAYVAYTGHQLDVSSQDYVDANLPKIISTWSEPALWARASPALRHAAPQDRVRALFRRFRARLGPLIQYNGCKGQSDRSISPQHGIVVMAKYVAHALFQNAGVTIRVLLIRRHQRWQILGLHVDSPSFRK